MNTYEAVIDYLYQALPMFHRIGKAAIKVGLDNTIALCNHLQQPQQRFKSIHIAGTNGKGSTSHSLAAILQAAGYKTGLYTSPHLKNFTERIRINGQEISRTAVIDFVNKHKHAFDQIQPSFFEMTVGMAFDHFARHEVDIAVIETGLGGRLDSTNIITPLLSLITNISYDHQDLLGDTLPQIASEKAGIIKPGIPAIIGEYQAEIAEVFIQKAAEVAAPLCFAAQVWDVVDQGFESHTRLVNVYYAQNLVYEKLQLDLGGNYQIKNLPGILQAVENLRKIGFNIPEIAVRQGLASVGQTTGLKGRWQILSENPLTVCDTGHNEAGIREIIAQINRYKPEQLHMVVGVVRDKDVDKILKLLPTNALYYFCEPALPRALPATELAAKAATHGLSYEIIPSVNMAIQAAQARANAEDMIFIGGSTFVVAEIDSL